MLTNDQPLSVDDGPGRAAHGVLYGLHLGRFAGPMLRGLLFFLGLLGTSLVASGLVMWTLKRRIRLATTNAGGRCGFWLVARLNIAAIAGLLIATGAIFWANRLLPVELGGRAEREVQCFLIAWGAALVHACCRPEKSAWREQLLMAAALFLLLSAVDALTAGRYLAAAGRSRDWVHLGFDVLALVLGGLLAVAAGKVGRRLRGAEPTDGMVPSGAMSPEVAS